MRFDGLALSGGGRAVHVAREELLGMVHGRAGMVAHGFRWGRVIIGLVAWTGAPGFGVPSARPPERIRPRATRPLWRRDFTVPTGSPNVAAMSSSGRS